MVKNSKLLFFTAIFIFITAAAFGEPTAKAVSTAAAQMASVDESINYIKSQLKTMTVASEKRSTYILLATIQEQLYYYNEAQKNYAAAAGISAADADGMLKKTNEQLVIDAVRCALCAGDYATADSYLNSAVRNSKNPDIQSYVKLYTQWSALCRADTVEDLNEPLELLQAYLKVNSMKSVHPVILLTLWYVTGNKNWSSLITKDFPNSTEAAIVKGDVQLLPTPFWFFVPKSGVAEQGTGTFTEVSSTTKGTEQNAKEEVPAKFSKWQLGLFKTESNAKLLAQELKDKGFAAYVTSEKRASGTTYYIVLVNEISSGNVAEKLRSSGYDCYPVE